MDIPAVSAIADRFDGREATQKYAKSLGGTRKHAREAACVQRGLERLSPGHRVLDLPCGTGRLLPVLSNMGFRVTACDISSEMIQSARGYAQYLRLPDEQLSFTEASVFDTGFRQYEFDGVVSNRLFHHFVDSATRVAALRELRRICAGPIVVSFFCNHSWDGGVFHLRERFRSTRSIDRVPISPRQFMRDVEEAGLTIVKLMRSRHVFSKTWYAVLEEWEQLRKPVDPDMVANEGPRLNRQSRAD